MKVAWVTPLAAESAIAGVTVPVADALRKSVDLELWTSDEGACLPTTVPVIRYAVAEAFEHALRAYDTVLYSMGDSPVFHRDVFAMSQRVPGIVVLHDFVMHHMVAACYLGATGGAERYVDAIAHWYGEGAGTLAASAFAVSDGAWHVRPGAPRLWESDRVMEFPLFEEVINRAMGVVVHSRFLRDRVAEVSDAPVCHLPLPLRTLEAGASSQRGSDADVAAGSDVPADRMVLLTVGNVNPNKRVRQVVDVLGRRPELARRVVYVVAGALPDTPQSAELRAAIARYRLDGTVRLIGRCTDAELARWLRRADICVTLRYPSMEGASLSVIEQMAAGKPVIVANTGAYTELPDDAVRKIPPGQEATELPAVLTELADDAALRDRLGAKAREYVEREHRADRYADGLAGFMVTHGDYAAMARITDRIGAALRDVGVRSGMGIVDRVAEESESLFGEPQSSPWRPGR